MHSFHEQKVVITGATRGIGRAIAQAFLNAGATVIGTYGSDKTAAENFLEDNSHRQEQLHLFQCNAANGQEVESFFAEVEQQFDYIDILINNAGIRRDALLALMNQEDWQKVLDVNLTGTFLMSKHAVLLMMKNKYGRIINITSPVAYLGFPGQANYSASKAGQVAMTKSLSKEVARKKITVNCVSPGFIDTDFIQDLTKEQKTEYKKLVPMRRFGKVEEVAAGVLFIASKSASYITGTVLEINGGI